MSAITEKYNEFLDKIKDSEVYTQIQNQYQQLPPEQQKIVKVGGISVIGILFLFYSYTIFTNANRARSEYFDQQELLMLVNQAGDEIRRLKGQNAGLSQSGTQNWKQHIASLAGAQGVPPANVEVSKETPGATKEILQETLLDVQIKGIQLRPLVQMLYQVEHGSIPMKLRSLAINSESSDGTLVAKLSVSGFSVKGGEKK